jgi:hypothetical protein
MMMDFGRKIGFGALVLALAAVAAAKDVTVDVDRAINNPTLTIRYAGAEVALVEVRLNGTSIGTRSISAGKTAGETNFTINPADLKDGENSLEIRLIDKAGRVIKTEKQTILSEQSAGSAVFMASPKLGQTVMGSVDIAVKFNSELKNSYVSYFVDGNFKGMSNYPPYSFSWDTSKETNGWHEIEGWAVDASSNTYKTRKIKVFVNNPGGRTDRIGTSALVPATNAFSGTMVLRPSGLKSTAAGKSTMTAGSVTGSVPKVTSGSPLMVNVVLGNARGSAAGLKPAPVASTVSMGPKLMTPTNTRHVTVATTVVPKTVTVKATSTAKISANMEPVKVMPQVSSQVQSVVSTMRLLAIQKGTRLPNISTFAVVYAGKPVKFDVAPRVDDGIPMTPFRYLFESAGGEVKWENMTKSVSANANGQSVSILIGDANAMVNNLSVKMETVPYLDRGRTIVPLSFLRDALKVNVDYDKKTNHVLITPVK